MVVVRLVQVLELSHDLFPGGNLWLGPGAPVPHLASSQKPQSHGLAAGDVRSEMGSRCRVQPAAAHLIREIPPVVGVSLDIGVIQGRIERKKVGHVTNISRLPDRRKWRC